MNRSHKNHFVICGWNFQGPRIIRELLNAKSNDDFDVVIAPGEKIPEKLKGFGNKIFIVECLSNIEFALQLTPIVFILNLFAYFNIGSSSAD